MGRAACLICIILVGYFFKRARLLSPDDFRPISRIIFYFTLPCAIINSLSGASIDTERLLIIPIGLGCNLATVAAGYLLKFHQGRREKAFAMINLSGYNIGNFAYPFIQSFLGPDAVMSLCLFDAGNSIMCTSGTRVITGNLVSSGKKENAAKSALKIFGSVPFDTYAAMFLLTAAGVRMPAPFLVFTGIAGDANTFLSMLMLGIGFEWYFEKRYRNALVYYIGIRFLISAAMAAGFLYFLPFDYEIRKTLAILVFAPVSTWSPIYSKLTGGDVALSSAITSFSILFGVLHMTLLLMLL